VIIRIVTVGIFLNLSLAAGPFAEGFVKHGQRYGVGPNPSAIAASDLNGDGLPEILTADRGRLLSPRSERPANNELSLLVAEGDLNYRYLEPLPVGFAPYDVVLANIDGQKALDIVSVSFMDTRQREPQRDLTLFRNLGEMYFERVDFTAPDERLAYKRMLDADGLPAFSLPGATSVTVGHLNQDNVRDALITCWASDAILFYPGDPESYFGEPRIIPCAGGPRDVALHDFDGDGNLDFAVTLYEESTVAVWRNDGQGNFEEAARWQTRGKLPHRIAIGDINADGKPDIAVSHANSEDSVVVYYAQGPFDFSVSQEIMLGSDRNDLEEEIRDFVMADLNGDGKLDLAMACWASARVSVFLNRSDDPSIPQRFERSNYAFGPGRPRALCTADFNQDGKRDIAVALWEENAVGLLLGR